MPSFLDDPLWTDADLEEVTGRLRGFWAKLRITDGGPPLIKIGNRVRYRRSAVLRWLEQQERTSTSDPGPAAPEVEPSPRTPARKAKRSAPSHAA